MKSGMWFALCLVAGFAQAQTIVVGTATSGNAIPFGGGDQYSLGTPTAAPIAAYQQIYSSSAFAGTTTIDSLSFYCNAPYCPSATALTSGSYSLFLSTTTAQVNALSTNLFSNVGTDQTLVYTGNVPGPSNVGLGNQYTFNLATDYTFNPTLGNLLLNISVANQGPFTIGLEADDSGNQTSRVLLTYAGAVGADSTGLVTGFGVKAMTAPEIDPSSAVVGLTMLFGLVAVMRGRRRHDDMSQEIFERSKDL